MKVFLIVSGIILIAVGAVWFFQGLNILLGSFMSGRPLWMWLGAIAVVAGAILLVIGLRLRKRIP